MASPPVGPFSPPHGVVLAPQSPADEDAASALAPQAFVDAPGTPSPPPLAALVPGVHALHALLKKKKLKILPGSLWNMSSCPNFMRTGWITDS